jgi:hypothetical protein
MGLQAAVHMGHMPWALTKEEEEELYNMCGVFKGTRSRLKYLAAWTQFVT